MDRLRLQELMSSIDFSGPYDEDVHRTIYDRVDELRPADPSTVTPSLVFYAVRNILSPTLIIGQIPDLLNLLALVETIRRFAALKSDQALEWQTYYEREKSRGRGQDVRLLAANEVRALQRVVVQRDAQRREYIVLIRTLVSLYIHYLWTAPESCLLEKRLNDIFPGSLLGVDMPSELAIHVDLSEDEKAHLGRLKLECHEWLNLVVDWENRREESGQCEGLSQEEMAENYQRDFCEAFPQPSVPSQTARNVGLYLKKVEDIVCKLEQWFPPSVE